MKSVIEMLLVFLALNGFLCSMYCVSIGAVDKVAGGITALAFALMLGGLVTIINTEKE